MVVENVFRYLFNVTLTTTVLTELTSLIAVRSYVTSFVCCFNVLYNCKRAQILKETGRTLMSC